MSLNYKQIMDYHEALVIKHHKLESFVGFSKQEMHNSLGKLRGKKYPMLILYDYEGKLTGTLQRTFSVRTISFSILFGGIALDDYAKQYQAMANAEIYGLEILSRINFDSKKPDKVWLYNNFVKDSVVFEQARLMNEAALYGMIFSYDLRVTQAFGIKAEHWEDITDVC